MAARIKKPLIRQAGSAEAFMGSAATGREQISWRRATEIAVPSYRSIDHGGSEVKPADSNPCHRATERQPANRREPHSEALVTQSVTMEWT